MKRISLLVLAGLIAGILVGELAKASGNPAAVSAVEVIEVFGGLWLNTLRMTVVPLVVSLLIVGVASVADTAKTGGLVARAVLLFTFLIFLAGAYSTAATLGMLELWPVDRTAADAFVASVGGNAVTISEPPTFVTWLQGLAPSNPVTAAAEDAVLQVVVFSIFFGFAVTKLDAGLRESIVTFFRAVSEAMIVIVRWVLIAGPFGVFALATGVGLRAGLDAATVLTQYVIIVSAATLGITIVAWLLAVTWGRQPIGRFTAAAAPVWAIAVSTQSSLASLPAMLDAALRGLGTPARVADVVLPLAVAVFRFTSPVANLAVVYFCAHLYGIEATMLQIGVGLVVAYAVSIAAVGLPGQVSFIASIAPICLALGVPTELLGILIAVEIIPDIFRTLGNVTGDLAATTILSGKEKHDEQTAV